LCGFGDKLEENEKELDEELDRLVRFRWYDDGENK